MHVYTDAARDDGIAATGWEIILDSGEVTEGNRYIYGDYTSMQAEYFALLDGTRHAIHHSSDSVRVVTDCEPLVGKMNGQTHPLDDQWSRRRDVYQRLVRNFNDFGLSWVPRKTNIRADRLAYEALERARRA